jgi:hypothetical protein
VRQQLFHLIGKTCNSIVEFNLRLGNFCTSLVAGFFNLINGFIRWGARSAMIRLDKERFEYTESLLTQRQELGELHLLMAATQVKEDALKHKMWTMYHTIAINRIAQSLHMGCGWELPRVHGYLRQVIESIPGMAYTAGDDLGSE